MRVRGIHRVLGRLHHRGVERGQRRGAAQPERAGGAVQLGAGTVCTYSFQTQKNRIAVTKLFVFPVAVRGRRNIVYRAYHYAWQYV